MGAAPIRPSRVGAVMFALIAALSFVTAASPANDHNHGRSWTPVWGIEVSPRWQATLTNDVLTTLRARGVTTLLLTAPSTWRPPARASLLARAVHAGLMVVEPQRTPIRCVAESSIDVRCARLAESYSQASALARGDVASYVVVRAAGSSALAKLRPNPAQHTRVVGVMDALTSSALTQDRWTTAVADAVGDPSVSLAVRPTSARSADVALAFAALVAGAQRKEAAGLPRDLTPPSAPSRLRSVAATPSTISTEWDPSTDDVGVAAYWVAVNGTVAGHTTKTTHTLSRLDCGVTYSVTVKAVDKAGNTSTPAAGAFATAPCGDGGGGGGGDVLPPSAPLAVAATSRTATTVQLGWQAATDNVGVAGYGIYVGGVRTTATSALTTTVSGLTCGTSYVFGVDASDAAGNRSTTTSVTGSTAPCATTDTQAPSSPGSFHATSQTATSISTAWTAATDNVGVTAYGLYNGGTLVASTTSPGATFANLSCGTTYTLAVDASDAAGNRSPKATLSAQTSSCPPPPAGGASVFVSPSGSDANPCTQPSPCKTLNRGYRAAAPGQTVELAGGTYPGETINFDSTKLGATSNVLIRPAAGASASITGELKIYAQHLEVDGVTIGDFYAGNNSASVPQSQQAGWLVFRNVSLGGFYIRGASNLSIFGGTLGPVSDAAGGAAQVSPCYLCPYAATNILVDGMYFHDVVRTPTGQAAGIHSECLHFWGGVNNVTVRNSRFFNCSIMDLYVENQPSEASQGYVHDVLIENNFFDAPGSHGGASSEGSYSLMFGPFGNNMNSIVARFNTSLSTMIMNSANGPFTNSSFVANYGYLPSWSCDAGITYAYNVWTGVTCGATDYQAPLALTDPSSGDLHLLVTSSAIARVPTTVAAPSSDIDGDIRPSDTPRDAGADER